LRKKVCCGQLNLFRESYYERKKFPQNAEDITGNKKIPIGVI